MVFIEQIIIAFIAILVFIVIILLSVSTLEPKLILIVIPIITIIVLAIFHYKYQYEEKITNNEMPGYFETKDEALKYNELEDYSDPFKFKEVGEKLEFEYISINNDDEYKIGYNGNEDLNWLEIGIKTDFFKIKVKDYIKKSYIERVDNEVSTKKIKGKVYYLAADRRYIIYIKSNSLNGGETTESCGKNCTREIKTDIIK